MYATATSTVLLMVMGSDGHIKQAIKDSGAYERFVPSIIESNTGAKGSSSIPLEDTQVVSIINKAFPPTTLQTHTNTIIDSVFSWLQGRQQNVRFTIDFTANKTLLGNSLSEYAFTNLAFKDQCAVQPDVFDPFTSDCRPANFDIFQGQKDFAEQIKSSEGFLGNTILTEQNLPKNKSGKNIFDQYSYAPRLYAWLGRAPILLGGATILAAIGYIWGSHNKRSGVMRLGKGVVANSLTLIITPFVFGFAIPWLSKNYTNELVGSGAEVLLNDIINSIAREFDTLMIWFGAVIFLVGALIVVGEKMTRSRNRYAGVEKSAGLASSNGKKSTISSPRGKLGSDTVPLQSSEVSQTKGAKTVKKNKAYQKIPL